jgi:hypothetical protein
MSYSVQREDTNPMASVTVSYPHLLDIGIRLSRAGTKVEAEPSLWFAFESVVESDTVSQALRVGMSEQRERAAVTASAIHFVGDAMHGIVNELKAADHRLAQAAADR